VAVVYASFKQLTHREIGERHVQLSFPVCASAE
jgi:hypothetical protein